MCRTAAFTLVVVLAATGGRAGSAGSQLARHSEAVRAAAPGAALRQIQPAETPPWLERLRSWLQLVDEHRPGTLDMAARLMGVWTEAEVDETREDFLALVAICKRELARTGKPLPVVHRSALIPFGDLVRLLGLTAEEAAEGNANRVLLRAAVFHADVAMLAVPLLPGRAGCAAIGTMLVNDGGGIGLGCLGLHWAQGRDLLDAVRPDPGNDPAVRLWYLATITYLLEAGDYADANLHIERARFHFPQDPANIFLHAYYHEAFASPYIQIAVVSLRANQSSANVNLAEAEGLFKRAVMADPEFVEARVRHGHVLNLLERHRDAARELRLAAASAREPRLRYYAELFLGRAEEMMGNLAEARGRYAEASALFPGAQSPLLALALLNRRLGDRAAAQEAMRRLLALPTDRPGTDDPWAGYYRWQNRNFEARFADLYATLKDDGRASSGGPR